MKKITTMMMALLMVLTMTQCRKQTDDKNNNQNGAKVRVSCVVPMNNKGTRSEFTNLMTDGSIKWSAGTERIYLAIPDETNPQIVELTAFTTVESNILAFEGEVEEGLIQAGEYDIYYLGNSKNLDVPYVTETIIEEDETTKITEIKGSIATQSGSLDDLGYCHIAKTTVTAETSGEEVVLSLNGTLKNQIAIAHLNLDSISNLKGSAIIGTEYALQYNEETNRFDFVVAESDTANINITDGTATSYVVLLPNATPNVDLKSNTSKKVTFERGIEANKIYYKHISDVEYKPLVWEDYEEEPEEPEEPEVPAAPTNLVATATGRTTISLTWDAVQNATSYKVYNNENLIASGLTATTYTVGNLAAETEYCYYVTAVNEAGESEASTAACATTESGLNGHECVDLGLPSGLLWASCNVGASSPENYGNYYAWGETEPAPNNNYSSSNCPAHGLSISELQSQGYIDDDGNLTSSHDAARANWGGSWRMPTYEEQKELLDNCTWTWTTQNGVNGYNVTGPNANSIFLSAAGYRNGSSLYSARSFGTYWSSTPIGSDTYYLTFNSNYHDMLSNGRNYGRSVRPVSGEEAPTAPAVPTNLVATANGQTEISLTWDAVQNATSYNVYNGETVVVEGLTVTSYTFEDLTDGTEYCYNVTAVNEIGESEHSTEACATTEEAPIVIETFTVNGVSFNMIQVEGGGFTMGHDSENFSAIHDEEPHYVTLDGFSIGETEVTQELWRAVMGEDSSPSFWWDRYGIYNPIRPAEHVSWYECQEFITKLNELTSKNFRLPTEAEWEYAARGGHKAKERHKYSGSNNIDEVGWYEGNYIEDKPLSHDVKTKKPNELGTYDMTGNVWEWCNDWHDPDYYWNSPAHNPQGPETGTARVYRGCGWGDTTGTSNASNNCRVAKRRSDDPESTYSNVGLRLCL